LIDGHGLVVPTVWVVFAPSDLCQAEHLLVAFASRHLECRSASTSEHKLFLHTSAQFLPILASTGKGTFGPMSSVAVVDMISLSRTAFSSASSSRSSRRMES
jgi:hypothetical protein